MRERLGSGDTEASRYTEANCRELIQQAIFVFRCHMKHGFSAGDVSVLSFFTEEKKEKRLTPDWIVQHSAESAESQSDLQSDGIGWWSSRAYGSVPTCCHRVWVVVQGEYFRSDFWWAPLIGWLGATEWCAQWWSTKWMTTRENVASRLFAWH